MKLIFRKLRWTGFMRIKWNGMPWGCTTSETLATLPLFYNVYFKEPVGCPSQNTSNTNFTLPYFQKVIKFYFHFRCERENIKFMPKLKNLFIQMISSKREPVPPIFFVNEILKSEDSFAQFKTGEQNCSSEFYEVLLKVLEEEEV